MWSARRAGATIPIKGTELRPRNWFNYRAGHLSPLDSLSKHPPPLYPAVTDPSIIASFVLLLLLLLLLLLFSKVASVQPLQRRIIRSPSMSRAACSWLVSSHPSSGLYVWVALDLLLRASISVPLPPFSLPSPFSIC